MKKKVTLVAALLAANAVVYGQNSKKDSLRTIYLDEVQVISTRATKKTPVAFTNIQKEELKENNYGKDIPFLISLTPSVITTSDAGAGIGYTSIRVRGTDPSRINVTANGIPMNDSESQTIFWVNTPDFASSLDNLQIQRGAGTSTNGSGAFGATINMKTEGVNNNPYATFSGSYGSFNTHKETVKAGTGVINNHWGVDVRLSNIESDGYRDRASSDLKSYFIQAAYFGNKSKLRFITFGGKEKTYHAWDGITKEMLDTDRTYNPNGEIKVYDPKTDKSKVVGFYDNQTDNYKQTHYQLLYDNYISKKWNMNIGLHYTHGFGYYQEYKNGRELKTYKLQPINGTGEYSDLIRKKNVKSDFGGGVFSFNYNNEKLTANLGGGMNFYTNDHYGNVIWVKNYTADLKPDYQYYFNNAKKQDGNIYAKANYELCTGLNIYTDLQYRYVNYKIDGKNDKWDKAIDDLQNLDVNETYNFFNPKAGVVYNINKHHTLYGSVAIAQKEPTRNNYTDGDQQRPPKSEKLVDYELGYTFQTKGFSAGVNLYYMDYTDQLVLTGKLNEIGEAMAENVKDSYRMGAEFMASAVLTKWLRWDANVTWSKNCINNYIGYVDGQKINVGNTKIAFSPSISGNNIISLNFNHFKANVQSQYVGRQYLDNYGRKESSIDPYFVSHLNLAYVFNTKLFKRITAGVQVFNLFNTKYETNGYSWASVDDNGKLNLVPYYYPMAGTNILGHLTIEF